MSAEAIVGLVLGAVAGASTVVGAIIMLGRFIHIIGLKLDALDRDLKTSRAALNQDMKTSREIIHQELSSIADNVKRINGSVTTVTAQSHTNSQRISRIEGAHEHLNNT